MKNIHVKLNGTSAYNSKIIDTLARLNEKPMTFCIVLSLILNLIVEMLSRRSVLAGISHMVTHPLIFVYNSLIILLTLSLAMFTKRKLFAYIIISDIWLILGLANCVLLGLRTTPLGAIDFLNISTALQVMKYYISSFEIVLIALLLVLLVVGIVLLWFKMPKQKTNYLRSAVSVVAVGILLFAATVVGQKSQALGSEFDNLTDAYENYGFVYCFSYGLVDSGITKPDGYSEEAIDGILEKIGNGGAVGQRTAPNVIFVQLESFFDINRAKDIKLSENPIPVFTKLREKYPSGFLTVPALGAGTANTEFEVITGMSLDYFGPGEYPYQTVLRDTTCESLCYNLAGLGYTSHAIHNNDGTFYQRNLVFPNLGFDTFTPIEYMYDVTYNPLGWAKDAVLTGEIMKTLDSTAGKDFIYTITVQGHGKYSSEEPDTPYRITETGIADKESQNEIDCYLQQLNETDQFIGELIERLSDYGEDVVLVLYGDHLPKLDISYEFTEGNSYQTEYMIWSNFGLEAGDEDLYSWQLGSHVLGLLGINEGVITKLNQSNLSGEEFTAAQNMLEYDLLYGEKYAYGGKPKFEATAMRMGTGAISISSVCLNGDTIYVKGAGFNEWSKIQINGDNADTLYINSGLLVAKEQELETGDSVTVVQSGDNNLVLGETDAYTYK